MEELPTPNKNPKKGELRGGATEVDGRPGKLTAQNKKSREGPHSSSDATEVDGHSGKKHKTPNRKPRGGLRAPGWRGRRRHYPGAQPETGAKGAEPERMGGATKTPPPRNLGTRAKMGKARGPIFGTKSYRSRPCVPGRRPFSDRARRGAAALGGDYRE